MDAHRELREATVAAVLRGAGVTAADLRARLAHGDPPGDLAALVAKIRTEAHTVTDQDWAAVAGGYSEDALFELVVAAVIGAADRRRDAAHRALAAALAASPAASTREGA